MGDEEKIDTMMKAFMAIYHYGTHTGLPRFNREDGYWMIKKGNDFHETVSDSWDGFKLGWLARESVDESTVEGW